MLDTKLKGSQRFYCDAIVCSDNIKTWEDVHKEYFKEYQQKMHIINGGHQVIYSNDSGVFITVSYFLGSGKFMVQPGQRKEQNVLKWLKCFPQLLQLYTNVHMYASGALPKSSDDKPYTNGVKDINNINEGKEKKNPSDGSSSGSKRDPSYTHELYVKMPTANHNSSSPPDERVVIVNELLSFTQNRMNTLPLNNVVKLCTDFYTREDIVVAKRLLFDNVKGNEYRHVLRKGDNNNVEDMRDIAVLLYSTEIRNTPRFVAEDLSNLPPLSASDFDVVKILKEVENVRQSVKLLGDSQSSLAKLVQDSLTLPRMQPSATGSASVDSMESPTAQGSPSEESYVVVDYTSCSDSGSGFSQDNDISDLSIRDDHIFAQRMQETGGHGGSGGRQQREGQSPRWRKQGKQREQKYHSSSPIRSRNHQQSDVIFGTGLSVGIKAASYNKDRHETEATHSNRTVTGVFVTRLSPRTTSGQIEKFVKRETGLCVRAEQLETRYNTYSSFYIPCDRNIRNTLLNASIWSEGILLKPFYS